MRTLKDLTATREEYAARAQAWEAVTVNTLPLFTSADNPPADEERRARYIKPASWLRGTVIFDAEEARAAIADRVKECRAQVEAYKAAISAAPAVYAHYMEALNAAEKVIESEAGSRSPLYYAIKAEK